MMLIKSGLTDITKVVVGYGVVSVYAAENFNNEIYNIDHPKYTAKH